MAQIKVLINGETHSYSAGIRLKDIANDFINTFKFPILVAKVDEALYSLNEIVNKNCAIEFFDCSSVVGSRIYEKGLIFVLIYAIKQLYGSDKDIVVSHAIDKGIYIIPTFDVTEEMIKEVIAKMKEVASQDLLINKVIVKRKDAIEYFKTINDIPKAESLQYNTNTYISLYLLDNIYNFFYSKMPISTSVFTTFNIKYINDRGFVLQKPVPYLNGEIPEYHHHEKMFEAFSEFREWMKMIKVENANDINTFATQDKIEDIIRMSEVVYNNQLLYLSKEIYEEKDRIKIVLIAGPSSSGKTTTSRKMALYFKGFGLNPKVISVDDYYLERIETPKKLDGRYDYESIDALDLNLFNDHMARLLSGEEITMPTYDFITGTKSFNNKMIMEENDILIIEGLHGLNEKLTSSIAKENKYKIYVSPLTEMNIDNHNRISSTDNRLLRRLVRDHRIRGYTVEEVLKSWEEVREGEEKYVFPFQDEADYVLNTANVYEIGVLKVYAEPLLYTVSPSSPYYEEAKRILNLLRLFLVIPEKYVPDDAILREFIGGGIYHH